ncbi:hypothetical protein [Nocardia sp. NPDC005366]|uniref:hypothetical protein n=1 Tax=Nocardia sp. NPDC005366 TaxID=3156878 RepID=UPI0033B164F5
MSDKDVDTTAQAVDITKVAAQETASEPQAADSGSAESDVAGSSTAGSSTAGSATAESATAESATAGADVADSSAPESSTVASAGRSGIGAVLGRVRVGKKGAVAVRTAAALLLGASLASSVYFFLQDRASDGLLAAHEQARAAACKYAPVLADYDAKNLDSYFAAVLAGATGDWKKQFDDTSRELKEVLSQGEVVSKANDVQCAIKSGDETSAEAIVVIGQTITSLGTQGKPAPGQLSMVMRMEKVDGVWLVNKVNSPLAPSPQQ